MAEGDAKRRKGSISKILVWIVLLLLIVGLAGFGATNFGGGVRVVGEVGETEITVERYGRELEQQIAQFEEQSGQQITTAEARQIGLDRVVLQRLVALAALEDEAGELGLSVGDEEVADEILQIQAFQGAQGFDRDAYQFALNRAGLSVAEFESQIRSETARALLQGALVAGIQPPDAFVDALYDFARETRDLTLVRFGPDELAEPIPAPTEEDLQTFHEENPDLFTLPERKRITFAWLTPEMLAPAQEIPEDRLREVYENRSEVYNPPERRLVERLVFADDAEAAAAAEAIAAGETTFDALVEDRGLTLDDVDLGDVSRDELGDAAETVFGLSGTGIAGPAPTPLGPALFRVNAVLDGEAVPFEEARPELEAELATGAALSDVESRIEPVSDLLAGGATIEEISEETPFELGATVWHAGEAGLDGADIDAYEAFRSAAAAAEPGDFPELIELSDGGLAMLRVDDVLDPELQPLDAVRAEVVAAWEAERLQAALMAQAEDARTAVDDGTDVAELGGTVETVGGVLRDGTVPGGGADVVARAFALPEGGTDTIATPEGAALVRVDAIVPPDGDTDDAQAIKRGVVQAAGQGIAEDITAAFTQALQSQKGISLNEQAISSVLSQLN